MLLKARGIPWAVQSTSSEWKSRCLLKNTKLNKSASLCSPVLFRLNMTKAKGSVSCLCGASVTFIWPIHDFTEELHPLMQPLPGLHSLSLYFQCFLTASLQYLVYLMLTIMLSLSNKQENFEWRLNGNRGLLIQQTCPSTVSWQVILSNHSWLFLKKHA